jgi:hypothetical protein
MFQKPQIANFVSNTSRQFKRILYFWSHQSAFKVQLLMIQHPAPMNPSVKYRGFHSRQQRGTWDKNVLIQKNKFRCMPQLLDIYSWWMDSHPWWWPLRTGLEYSIEIKIKIHNLSVNDVNHVRSWIILKTVCNSTEQTFLSSPWRHTVGAKE